MAAEPAKKVKAPSDPELHAMAVLVRVLEPLDKDARERALGYAIKRFGSPGQQQMKVSFASFSQDEMLKMLSLLHDMQTPAENAIGMPPYDAAVAK